jgi:hypothetical protein
MFNSEKPHDVWTAYSNSVEAHGTQQLQAITGLSLSVDGSDISPWEEVEVPGVENFKKARDYLQTPKLLKLGPLLAAAVETSPAETRNLQSINKLDPPPDEVGDQEDMYRNSCLVSMFQDWNRISENFASLSQELRQRGLRSWDYKIAVNEAISKLQSGLEETNTKIQLAVVMLGNPPMSLSVGRSLTTGDSLGQIRFKVAGLKESMDGGQQWLEDLKQIEKHTPSELLDLTLSFDNLAESYTMNLQAIKSKLVALERSSTSMGINGSSRECAGCRNMRWDNLTLDSPDVGSSFEDQLTGLRTWVSDLEYGGLSTQSDRELRRLNEELKALDQKVSAMPTTSSADGSSTTTIRQINVLQQRIKDMEGRGGEHGWAFFCLICRAKGLGKEKGCSHMWRLLGPF